MIGSADVFHSKILNEDRVVNVYLPEGYRQNDGIEYPVIYVLDGGMEEDFLHIMGIVRFNTQPWKCIRLFIMPLKSFIRKLP